MVREPARRRRYGEIGFVSHNGGAGKPARRQRYGKLGSFRGFWLLAVGFVELGSFCVIVGVEKPARHWRYGKLGSFRFFWELAFGDWSGQGGVPRRWNRGVI